MRNRIFALLIILGVIVLDQGSKAWVLSHFALGESYAIFSCLNIQYAMNTGAAFSFLAGSSNTMILIVIPIIIFVVICVWLWRNPTDARLENTALLLVLGGGLGNLIDRLRYQAVVDFIDFHIGHWHFATFNVADSAVSLGIGLLLLNCLLERKQCGNSASES